MTPQVGARQYQTAGREAGGDGLVWNSMQADAMHEHHDTDDVLGRSPQVQVELNPVAGEQGSLLMDGSEGVLRHRDGDGILGQRVRASPHYS